MIVGRRELLCVLQRTAYARSREAKVRLKVSKPRLAGLRYIETRNLLGSNNRLEVHDCESVLVGATVSSLLYEVLRIITGRETESLLMTSYSSSQNTKSS